jgi:hypothetical protein
MDIEKRNQVIERIAELNKLKGTPGFSDAYLDLFSDACKYLRIPENSGKQIAGSGDSMLVDSIIRAYFYGLNINSLNIDMGLMRCLEVDRKEWSERRKKPSLWVEPLISFGIVNNLPSSEVVLEKAAYIFINHQPYLVNLTKENHLAHEDDDFYSEQKWADKETAILLAVINLSKKYGFFSFFTGGNGFYIPISLFFENSHKLSPELIDVAKDKVGLYEYVHGKTWHYRSELGGGFDYGSDLNLDRVFELNKLIDRNDSVLVRCLYYFAKACSFIGHKMTMEESTALQMFCLDGLAELFMKKYGVEKRSDLDSFLQKNFNCPYGQYLKELHDERTVYVHPSNKHGEYWCPPWDADTCLDTLPVVKDMICLYLTGKFKSSDSSWDNAMEEIGCHETKQGEDS